MLNIPKSTQRVRKSTQKNVNQKIQKKGLENIEIFLSTDMKYRNRLDELNREWDTERVLETNASILIVISTILGFLHSPYWHILSAVIAFFLLIHAVYGWCTPLPIIRRLGIRTPYEICNEKTIINYLR